MNTKKLSLPFHAFIIAVGCGIAQPSVFAAQPPSRPATVSVPEGYRLAIRDTIEVTVYDEPDLTAVRQIDSSGHIYLNLLNAPVPVANKTLREVEKLIADLYKDGKILKNPAPSVKITEYAPREVEVTGQVNTQGMLAFPKEKATLELSEVIARCGGFTERAKRSSVEIWHVGEDGQEKRRVVNADRERVTIYPGDRIKVNEIII